MIPSNAANGFNVHAPPSGPYGRAAHGKLSLGVPGFEWEDLFAPSRLGDLYEAFDRWFAERAPEAHARFASYRACLGEGMTPEAQSAELLAAAPHVSAFVTKLFGIEADAAKVKREVDARGPLWKFRREFAKKRVLREGAGKSWAGLGFDANAAGWVAEVALGTVAEAVDGDEELFTARGTVALFEVDDVARKAKKQGGAQWSDELRARARAVLAALEKDLRTRRLVAKRPAAEGDDDLAGVVAFALDAIEAHLAARRADHQDAARRWPSLRQPHSLDFKNLVQLRRPDAALPELFVGPDEERRQRKGFKLTDKRGSAREVEQEVDYCMYCHERGKDSCSKGFRDKEPQASPPATDPSLRSGMRLDFKKNPLGVELRGCPLEEKISEMHVMRREGDVLAALALVTVDNPMCAGTGHRICNDCMKACVFQKQEPVNIPQVETRVLTEVLTLPWGLEIYMLLMRWNPLNVKRPHMRPYNGRNVLVIGLGPAGYTLAHHLACEGFGVVAVDGLKLEPLPPALTGGYGAQGYEAPSPIKDATSIYGRLDERIMLGFGGVSEYGITVRWDKNFLTLTYLSLARSPHVRMYGGIRFGGTMLLDDAWQLGFDHVAIAAGAGKPTLVEVKNNLARGIRQASDFLMALQLSGAYKRTSIANLQVSLPAIVIGGGLTAIDTATELLAYYQVQVEKTVERMSLLERELPPESVRALFDDEEWRQLQEHLAHGRALRAEKDAAKREGRDPDVQKLLDSWGGVTLVYRKSLQDSPAYRLNHEEVIKSLEEGVRYVENLSPTEAVVDDHGQVRAMKFQRKNGELVELPAKTICVAAGTSPNVTYEKEHPGTFALDDRQHYFRAHAASVDAAGQVTLSPVQDKSEGFFTSYCKDNKTVSFYGDNHPYYAGSVVKAMASAKDGHPHVVALFPETRSLDPKDQPARDAKLQALFAKLDDELVATVVEVNRLTKTIVEVVVHAPMATRKFNPGQFYRLQNFETRAPVVKDTRLAMEGLALTGAWVDPERGLMGTIVLEMGSSSRLCAVLQPGEPVVLMGPTGAPTEIAPQETVLLCGGGLGNAVLFSIARAFKAMGSKVVYFAGYKDGADVFKQEDIERYTDQVVWSTDTGAAIQPHRPQDVHFRGNVVQAMLAYAKDEIGVPTVAALAEVKRIIAIGSDRMMNAVREARHGVLLPYLDPRHIAIGSINSPMQCMMKEVCAQCLQRHVDPKTGKQTVVFTCFNQDQDLDTVDFGHLRQRLRLNSMQEKLSSAWLDHLLRSHPELLRV
ncbi:MAG TPA: FAD-dependent oxidoreductase [Polyangiaceae bacterium]|nr:FAD-dependent oxidoreductase [Polyangiaceae bacterium]